MSGGGCTRGAKPPRVDPSIGRPPARAAVLPTHTVSPGAGAGDGATASSHLSMAPVVAIVLCTLVTIAAILFLSFFGSWMVPVVSIDGVTATGLDAAAAAGNATTTISPSFDVAVRVKMRRFHLAPEAYARGSVAVSCAGGAVTARGELPDFLLYVTSPSVVSATVRAAPPTTALSAGARGRLTGELRRGEVRLDVSVAYRRSEDDPGSMLSNGFRAMCAATASLGHGNSTATAAAAACTVVKQ
uniref:Late embryogenesis abundant protein LEA-2 subgroup domain-containing protein n=1 Tax=Oryza meridionalis TaxID=40149 RepID=A0A0E0EZ63_9ORYZ